MACILVVDDERHVTRLIRLRLEGAGYQVETAHDGTEALERLERGGFDAVVTDFNMPRMDGQELCEAIRARFPEHPLPIFLMTARIDSALRAWAESLPGIDYLEKPISLRELVSRLESLKLGAAEAAGGAG